MKHTQGPWDWSTTQLKRLNFTPEGNPLAPTILAEFFSPGGGDGTREMTANLKLCAYAPDLLDVLKCLVGYISSDYYEGRWEDICNASEKAESIIIKIERG